MPQPEHAEWKEKYKHKEIDPDKLVEIIKPGSRVYFGSACSEPVVLTSQLAKNMEKFVDCQIYHFFTLSDQKFFVEEQPSLFRHNTLSIIGSPSMRDAINKGISDYTPIMSSSIPPLLKGIGKRLLIDVALVQVSPPDKNGFCSLGTNVDINMTMCNVAKTVIVHINPQMPWTMGNSFIKLSDIDYFVYEDAPLLEFKYDFIDADHEKKERIEKMEKIARYISRLIEHGSTLNFGLGKIPHFLPKYLTEKKDLGIYSEMLPESVIPLIEENIVTCAKNRFPHCMTSLIIGSKRFFNFVDKNPFIEIHPTEYICHVPRIAKNHKLCSIYGALEVDLVGQATNHTRIGMYSGIGGESEFMMGSSLTKGGKCIVALPSITLDGRSSIRPILDTQPVSLRAFDVHYIVTEWGIAYLHGKSVRERILQMIGVAHPKFRERLLELVKEQGFIYEDQKIPKTSDGVVVIYPDIQWTFQTKDKEEILIRPIKITDERLMQDLYYKLDEYDRISRFFTKRTHFEHSQIQQKVVCDYQTKMTLVAVVGEEEEEQIIGATGYQLNKDTGFGEFAITVAEEYRGQGLAKFLMNKLIEVAQEKGIRGFYGDYMTTNRAMSHILHNIP
ncbi:MAG: GNAT family N-acetyltransferase, partial [Promethearchaeia archaeon]